MATHKSTHLDSRTLEERFFDFLGQLDGSESIDDCISTHELGKSKRADYLLRNRDIVVEVKTLKHDPEYKIEERLKLHRNRPEFPVFYWPSELSEILPYLSDGEEIRRNIFDAITNAIQKAVRNADDQIAETKKTLGISNACGVLVLLNEAIGILSPEIVTIKANQLILQKRGGDFRFKEIAYIWIISEGHLLQCKDGPQTLPLVLLEGPYADNFKEEGAYLDSLQRRWSAFAGLPLFHLGRMDNFNGLKFDRRHQPMANKSRMDCRARRYGVWNTIEHLIYGVCLKAISLHTQGGCSLT